MFRRRAPFVAVSAVLAAALIAERPAGAEVDDRAEGQRHAKKASELAAAGRCRQAIPEYDQAISLLRDPALLFNRAECHRKLGEAEAALEDYNQFLADLPQAPNRALVQARIAELSKVAPASAPARTVVPPREAAVRPSAPRETGAAPAAAASPSPAAARAPEASSAPVVGAARPPAPADLASSRGRDVRAPIGPARGEPEEGGSLVRQPWFWVGTAVVVAVIVVGALVVLRREPTDVPASDLGNYRF